jgi:uncharacterized DUF497 family protein
VAFIWDKKKATTNLSKHGIEFPFAVRVFEDAAQFEWPDDRIDYGEQRLNVVGLIAEQEILVTYTMRGEDVRILSARMANRHEREDYWRG